MAKQATAGEVSISLEHQFQHEVASFLEALNSYADRFKEDPLLSFQQYFASLAAQDDINHANRQH